MLIDWFTVGAQVINFLVLVWLLKRFLYKPILAAIDAREVRIAAELASAAANKAEALKEREDFEHKNAAFEAQRAALLQQATEAVKAERRRLLDEARQAADALSTSRMQTLQSDSEQLNQSLRHRVQTEVFAIARKALTDLATASLDEQMAAVFTRRLQALDGPAKEAFAKALRGASEPALVRSAFDLPTAQRAAIQAALNETLLTDIEVRFKTAPELVAGIELTANGQKLAWSIADYLTGLEQGVTELLKTPALPEPAAAQPKPSADHNGT